MNTFFEKLNRRWDAGAYACIGLDSDYGKLPPDIPKRKNAQVAFNERIIKATRHVALAYKPNIAFYSDDSDQIKALVDTVLDIRELAPGVPIILDGKRGDIDNTNMGYVREAFENIGADAVTLAPYLGRESLLPFLNLDDKGCFILCRTSNKGAGEFQDLIVEDQVEPNVVVKRPLYLKVARNVAREWNDRGNCGLVVGATAPEQIALVRKEAGDMWLLIPGIGAQGGDLEAAVKNGLNSQGRGVIVNSSRGIIFAKDPGGEAEKLNNEIRAVLETRT